jgi:3-oxoacyl-(acyl-carrier-protein) synthase
MARRRVAITGLGLITAFGAGVEPLWEGLMAGRSAVAPARGFDTSGLPVDHAAELPEIDLASRFTPRQTAYWSRATGVAALAAAEAWADAGLDRVEEPYRAGLFLGSGCGCTYELEEVFGAWRARGMRGIKPITIPRGMANAPASQIAILLGLKGPCVTVTTACSSGALAIGLAVDQIRHGGLAVCVTGGVEAALNASTFAAWCSLGVLSRRNDPTACRPFSADRDGLVLADGCAVLVLEEWERAKARGARIWAEIRGAGATNDARGIVEPDPAGEAEAMRAALADAGLAAADLGYVNAHGTGTRANDASETRALKAALGAAAYRTPVSSVKGHLGHALGAAGAIEAAVTALALARHRLPPTLHYIPGDPECDLDYVAHTPRDAAVAHALTNSFGFGGQNSSLVLSAVPSAMG